MGTTTSNQTTLNQVAQRLATTAIQTSLSPLDAALLTTLISSNTTTRDHTLAALAGHHPAETPTWLTDGPNDPTRLKRALAVLEDLQTASDAVSGPQLAAMRAWVLWALHRPTEALTCLRDARQTRFGALLGHAIAVCPPPPWKEASK